MKPACKSCTQEHEHIAGFIRPLKNKLCIYEKVFIYFRTNIDELFCL